MLSLCHRVTASHITEVGLLSSLTCWRCLLPAPCCLPSPSLQTNTWGWRPVGSAWVTVARTSWKVVLRIFLVSSAVNSLGKKMWGQAVALGVTVWEQEGFALRTVLGTEEAGG